jgi:hypothetical protein
VPRRGPEAGDPRYHYDFQALLKSFFFSYSLILLRLQGGWPYFFLEGEAAKGSTPVIHLTVLPV